MAISKFYNLIKDAQEESAVDHAFREGFEYYFPNASYTRPYKCDGYLVVDKNTRVLIEYKHDIQMKNRVALCKVILQVIFYLKKFEENGQKRPNIYIIGDKNEVLVSHTNELKKYLDEEIDWRVSPSTAWQVYPDFLLKLVNDEEINPFVFDIDDWFSFKTVADKIESTAKSEPFLTHISKHSIRIISEYFFNHVVKSTNVASHQLVETLIGCILDKDNYYLHPSKSVVVTPNTNIKELPVNRSLFKAMMSQFDGTKVTLVEEKVLRGCADELIKECERRRTGDFWTPVQFCDKAQEILCEQLGEDYRDNYVVWDCCCGGKNLTRDYYFKNLYCSTLLQSEIGIGAKFNLESTTFQFDFLNDDLTKLPQNLLEDLKANKPIVFLINPPYGTAGSGRGKASKTGISNTKMGTEMKQNGLDGCDNLQHQFLYRINQIKQNFNLTDVTVAVFSEPIWLSGNRCKKFLTDWCNNFEFQKGILFQASHFANVSGTWGITFNIWKNGKTEDVHNFEHQLVTVGSNDEIYDLGKKTIYNVWDQPKFADWVREGSTGLKMVDAVNVSSAINVCECRFNNKWPENSIAHMYFNGAKCMKNQIGVNLFCTPFAYSGVVSIVPANFERANAAHQARRLVPANWVNDKDEYLIPNQGHPEYDKFVKDSVVMNLFYQQAALRGVEFHNQIWDVKNEYFWMSHEELAELANENRSSEVENDLRKMSGERFVYDYLKENRQYLSSDVRELLQMLDDAVKSSFKYRNSFKEEHPEYYINAWDAGWYQIKAILKEFEPETLKAIFEQRRKCAKRMESLVYELGFLKK